MAEQNTGHRRGAGNAGPVDVFLKSGPGQNAVLATVVTFAGQAAAQVGLRPPWPTLTAIGFALLVAVYNVRMVQKLQGLNCLVLIPMVALIAFTSGWGANGLIDVAKPGGKVGHGELESLVDVLKKENASLEQRLQLQADELTILRKLSGVPGPVAGPSGHLENRLAPISSSLSRLLDALAPSAHAQPTTTTEKPPSPAEREKLLGELREKQGRQKALADETERLRKEREKAEKGVQQLPPWRKW